MISKVLLLGVHQIKREKEEKREKRKKKIRFEKPMQSQMKLKGLERKCLCVCQPACTNNCMHGH